MTRVQEELKNLTCRGGLTANFDLRHCEMIKNSILIMSGGVGSRFVADSPKQFCMMGGKQIIEYAINAARFCKSFRSDK